ncbi:MAG: transcription elongation factor GreA [Candidatus Komeilibacteria bacterium]|nr:transcription elongation factor GreA [Candidatus Komeilibacteria bacterium]
MAELLLSPEGVEKLKKELLERKELRRAIADRIAEAKELGDLSENAEYHQARDDQGYNEGRLMEIEQMLKEAKIVNKNDNSSISIGSTVKLKLDDSEVTYTIAGATEADPAAGLISCESPLGTAFIGKSVGDEVQVETPAGILSYKVLSIK